MSETAVQKTSFTIAGAGPVGALLAVILGRAGYRVRLFESRPDSRQQSIYQGKSINIALSDRGWLALEAVGIDEQIREQAIPMSKRIMHGIDGSLTSQDYGKEGQAIWSVSRSGINERLLDLAEQEAGVEVHFEKRLRHVDFGSTCATFTDRDGGHHSVCSDYLFGADGAYSKVRRLAQETPRFSYSQSFMPQCYIELNIAPDADGSFKMEKGALHIWPRKDFMLIALPNPDGSFTCTLFLNYEGEVSFAALRNREQVEDFFNTNFPDAMELLENPIDDFMEKSANPLFLVHVDPWVINSKVALIGDAAHAMVPFYGQGMNCGFEDCRELGELIDQHQGDWAKIFPDYHRKRKANADAITELARRNFVEMSDLAGDPKFLLQKKIEAKFHRMYPELWTPLYSMVTFSPRLPYAEALARGEQQKIIMRQIMQIPDIENCWREEFVYKQLHDLTLTETEH